MKKTRLNVHIASPVRAVAEALLDRLGCGRMYDGVIGPDHYKFNESADSGKTLDVYATINYLGGGVTRESEGAVREMCTQAAETWGIEPRQIHFHGYTRGLNTKDILGNVVLDLDRKKAA